VPTTRPSPRTFLELPNAFWLLIFGMFVNRLGAFVLPFLSLYLREHERLGASGASWVLGSWGVGTVASALLGGQLTDRWGRRPTMLASLLGGALVLAALAVSHALPLLCVFAFTLGLVAELYRPAVAAAISDLAPPEHRARAFAALMWSYNLGFAVSPVLAGWIAHSFGYPWLFVGDAATMLAGALVIGLGFRESRPEPAHAHAHGAFDGIATALADRRFRPMLIAALAVGAVMIQFASTLGPLMDADGIDVEHYGRIVAVNGLLIVLTQPWLVPLAERAGRAFAVPISALLFCGGFALHGFANSQIEHVLALCVWTAGEVALFPMCNAIVADLSPIHLRGRYQGLYWMAWASANVYGPPLGLNTLDRFGPHGWSALIALCAVVGVGAFFAAVRRGGDRVDAESARP